MIWLRIMSDPQIAQATVNDLKKALNEHENMILLDVRSVGEFVRGRIAGSVNLPLQDAHGKLVVGDIVYVIFESDIFSFVIPSVTLAFNVFKGFILFIEQKR